MDDMNTLKNYDNFKRKYVCNNNTIITYSMCIKFVVIAFHKDNYKLTELLRKRSSVCQESSSSSPREEQLDLNQINKVLNHAMLVVIK